MVHPCSWQDCGLLTMGEFCIDHEQRRPLTRRRRLQQLASVTAVVAVASIGAVLTRAYWR
jgi:hypothetical protein